MRALVTGGNGFVGTHLVAALRANGDEPIVAGRTSDGTDVDLPLDLSDFHNVRGVVELARPDVVYHLAAQAYVPDATRDPLGTYDVNALGTARLLEALRASGGTMPRFLYVSSAEVYGIREAREYPLTESASPNPTTPYAASKLAGEAFATAAYHTYGVPTIVARSFNHIGPDQSDRFVVPNFARQLAEIAAGGSPLLTVGNLEAKRDFLDVRDVVRAYIALVARGATGETYNVCSGVATSIADVLRRLVTIAHVAVEIREDPERMRPSDIPLSVGDPAKLRAATGWTPEYTLDASLRDVYADARDRLAPAR